MKRIAADDLQALDVAARLVRDAHGAIREHRGDCLRRDCSCGLL